MSQLITHTPKPPVRPGRILVVSQQYGDDLTAPRAVCDWNRPWKTLAGALNAAVSGDTIHVIDGAFTAEPTLTLKNGVHWEFSAGASFTGTFSDVASNPANPSCAISALGDGLATATLTKSGSGTVTLVTPTKNNRDITFSGTATIATLAIGTGGVVFEGSTADAYETTLTVTDPTADRTITLPNADATLVGGTYTSAATGDASGLTSGTLPDARLSGNVVLDNGIFSCSAAGFVGNFGNLYADGLVRWDWTRSGSSVPRATYWFFSPANADSNPGFSIISAQNSGLTGLYGYIECNLAAGGYLGGYSVQIDGSGEYGLSVGNASAGKFRVGGLSSLNTLAVGATSPTTIKGIRSTTITFDLPDTATQTNAANATATISGVTTTDTPAVILTFSDPSQVAGWDIKAAVTGADTITIYSRNLNSGNSNPGSVTCRVTAITF